MPGLDWQPLVLFFDRVFVITLARASERRAVLAKRLAGLDYTIHYGVDWRQLDCAQLEREGYDERRARQASRLGRPMQLGQIACAISHRRVYEEILAAGLRRALIFEDDVVPRPAQLPLLSAVLDELPPDWDLVYLGCTNFERVTARDRARQAAYLLLSALQLMKWTPREVLRLHPRPYRPHLKEAGLHHGAYAYGVSAAGARKLLAAQRPLAQITDQLFIHLILRGELKAFVAEPRLFAHDDVAARTPASSFVNERPCTIYFGT